MRRALLVLLLWPVLALAADTPALQVLAVEEPPLSYVDADGKPVGYAIDVLRAIQQRVGTSTPLAIEPESRVYASGLRLPNVVMLSFSRTPEREASFHWLARIARKPWVFYARDGDARTMRSLNELRLVPAIGVITGDVREQWLQALGLRNLVRAANHEQAIRQLQAGRVDVLFDEPQAIAYYCRAGRCGGKPPRPVWAARASDVYILMSKRGTDPALARAWQAAADAVVADGTLARIAHQWSASTAQDFGMRSTVRGGVLDFCVDVRGC